MTLCLEAILPYQHQSITNFPVLLVCKPPLESTRADELSTGLAPCGQTPDLKLTKRDGVLWRFSIRISAGTAIIPMRFIFVFFLVSPGLVPRLDHDDVLPCHSQRAQSSIIPLPDATLPSY
jgi:hypothetical protein